MRKTILPIIGMHCKSCSVLITESLKKVPGTHHLKVSYARNEAEIHHDKTWSAQLAEDAVRDAGYSVGLSAATPWVTRRLSDYVDLVIAAVFIIVIVVFARALGLGQISSQIAGSPENLWVVLLIGLTAGISTCMALVGGLVLSVSARYTETHPNISRAQRFRPHLWFNLGRIALFALFGGFIGLIGQSLQISSGVLGGLTIIVGLVMFWLGLQLTEISPRLSRFKLTLPAGISRRLGITKQRDKKYSGLNTFILGGLTFFLPCGFTQAMQLYALSTGSFWSGALVMSVFALGTTPGLIGLGSLSALFKGLWAKRFFKIAGIAVIAFAFFNISNGFNLTGWQNPFNTPKALTAQASLAGVEIKDGVQTVLMTQNTAGYQPNEFVVKKDVPVKWIVTSKDAYSCAASLVATKIGVRKNLSVGENIFEFTPKETGEIKFSCSMGMYNGRFIVTDSGDAPSGYNDAPADSQQASGTGGCPCCGGGQGAAASAPTSDTASAPPESTPAVTTTPTPAADRAPADKSVQLIKTTYASAYEDISPNKFSAKAGQPVRMEIEVKENGAGCMSTIMIPGLVDSPAFLQKGKTIVFEFTPQRAGSFLITCAMGVPRGSLTVN